MEDLILHRYEIAPTEEELRLLPDGGESDFHHQRDLLKARLAAQLDALSERIGRLSRDEAEWRLSVLAEMIFECRRHGHWGGEAALPRLAAIRDRIAARLRGQ